MTKTKKYVRILKARYESSWYADKIGEVFELTGETVSFYDVRVPGVGRLVNVEDAELIVTEKRPAKVGERILIVDDELGTYNNGQIHKVHKCVSASSDNNEHIVTDAGFVFWTSEYEVIVNNEVKNEEDDEVEIDLDAMGYDELIEHGEAVMRAISLRSYGEGYKQGKFDADMEATYMRKPEKTAQERRDEIVEQAKADVSGLLKRDIGHDHEFIVNTEKRTVVVLRKLRGCTNIVRRGIAKAAPDDCFNVHIGEAIALHRALGLEVPDEYLNAPQPTEVRVGDVVECGSLKDVRHVKVVADGEYIGTGLDKAAISSIAVTRHLRRIIDDSRTEVGE
ncbi:hypothetical protein OZL92_17460 [Bacillus sonorensis]|uniref:Uncharacterized protein n=2 Tax=Bacillus sonorensis TaxID=119858 RepID=M5NYE8_9BACI|nr:hypothetical protein [Bacillus sonorensis]EME72198.1 hypothetical protein BSONL12_22910 [Bacillus sonorensis L12]MCZ0075476.1 hypothetical protein [Bacillus sonorensis]MCZ0093130.1 hypothetical protein [Bacillus sonorensis]